VNRPAVLAVMVANGLALSLLERAAPHAPEPPGGTRHHGANLTLTALLVALNVVLDRLLSAFGLVPGAGAPGAAVRAGLPGWAALLAVVVVLDGLAYAAHVLLHALPAAWRFHRVHHSDARVDVTTAFRQHPLETVWRYCFLFAGAAVLDAPPAFVAVYLALSAANAQFEHASVALPDRLDRALRVVFSTPAMHRVHHSRRQPETDRNYSNIFSFWDRLLGTYRAPVAGERIACGLDDQDDAARQRVRGLLALPFGRT